MTSCGPCYKCNERALHYSPPHKVWYCSPEHSPFKDESVGKPTIEPNRAERRAQRKKK